MALRFTDTKKWEDEWFYLLSPKLKLAWIYLCDHMDGSSGVWKMNLPLLGERIGGAITKEEFDAAFKPKMVRISEGQVWFPRFIMIQYKKLSPRNKAHRGMMRNLVEMTADLPLEGDVLKLIEGFKELLADNGEPQLTLKTESPDPQQTLTRGSVEGAGNGNGNGKGEVLSPDGGTGGKVAPPSRPELAAAKEAWARTLGHWQQRRKVNQADEIYLARLLQRLGPAVVLDCLAGFRAEKPARDFDPKQHLHLARLEDPAKRSRLQALGAELLASEAAGELMPADPPGLSGIVFADSDHAAEAPVCP